MCGFLAVHAQVFYQPKHATTKKQTLNFHNEGMYAKDVESRCVS